VAEEVVASRKSLRGLRIVQQASHLRHFTAKLAPL
jgi:tryptophanase